MSLQVHTPYTTRCGRQIPSLYQMALSPYYNNPHAPHTPTNCRTGFASPSSPATMAIPTALLPLPPPAHPSLPSSETFVPTKQQHNINKLDEDDDGQDAQQDAPDHSSHMFGIEKGFWKVCGF